MPTQEEKILAKEIEAKIEELNHLLFKAWDNHFKVEIWRQDLNSKPINVQIIHPEGFVL